MKRYWLQNDTKNFQTLITKFIERLHKRGHSIEKLSPLFHQAAIKLEGRSKPLTINNSENSPNTLYIHWTHHPNGLQSRTLKKIYSETLQPHLKYYNTLIAISRPKNLKDTLTKAALSLPEGKRSSIILTPSTGKTI
jgi:hypothetical protein